MNSRIDFSLLGLCWFCGKSSIIRHRFRFKECFFLSIFGINKFNEKDWRTRFRDRQRFGHSLQFCCKCKYSGNFNRKSIICQRPPSKHPAYWCICSILDSFKCCHLSASNIYPNEYCFLADHAGEMLYFSQFNRIWWATFVITKMRSNGIHVRFVDFFVFVFFSIHRKALYNRCVKFTIYNEVLFWKTAYTFANRMYPWYYYKRSHFWRKLSFYCAYWNQTNFTRLVMLILKDLFGFCSFGRSICCKCWQKVLSFRINRWYLYWR